MKIKEVAEEVLETKVCLELETIWKAITLNNNHSTCRT